MRGTVAGLAGGTARLCRPCPHWRCLCGLDAATSGGLVVFDTAVAAIAALRRTGRDMHAIAGCVAPVAGRGITSRQEGRASVVI